jgi:Mrp family chromosome partitioning ATPase
MKGISLIPSGLVLNRLFKSPQQRNQKMVLVDLDEYVPSMEARVNASERHELASQALAAEKEIMYAIENLNSKLDNSEIYA